MCSGSQCGPHNNAALTIEVSASLSHTSTMIWCFRNEIAHSYLGYVKCLGRHSQKITVVFNGYSSSPKDHDYFWHTQNSCCDVQMRPDNTFDTKGEVPGQHSQQEWIHPPPFFNIPEAPDRCRSVWQWCWYFNCKGRIGCRYTWLCWGQYNSFSLWVVLYYLQVQAEDADVLIMLIHHSSSTSQPLFFTSSKGSWGSRNFSLKDKDITCSFVMHSLGLTQFLPLLAMGKLLYSNKFCACRWHRRTCEDLRATKEAVVVVV